MLFLCPTTAQCGALDDLIEVVKTRIPSQVEINDVWFDISVTGASVYTCFEAPQAEIRLRITDHLGASVTDADVMLSYSSRTVQMNHTIASNLAPGAVPIAAVWDKYYDAGRGICDMPTYHATVGDHDLLFATGSAPSMDENTGEEVVMTQCNLVWSDDSYVSIMSQSTIKVYGADMAYSIMRYLVNFASGLF
jgi:hypothetical protein